MIPDGTPVEIQGHFLTDTVAVNVDARIESACDLLYSSENVERWLGVLLFHL